LLFRSP